MRAIPHRAGHGLRAITVVSCTVLLAGVSAGGAAAASVSRGNSGPAVPGGQQWVSRYNGSASGADAALSVAVSPGGSAVFVTGISGGSHRSDYATVGYDAATGAPLWASRYSGPGNNGDDEARQVTVSPDGGTVFVTGFSTGATSGEDYATVAYDAATGAQLWASRYNGPGNANDEAFSLAVSPDGAAVFVTGLSRGITSGLDYATVAYNAATGARQWARRYNGPKNGRDVAYALAVSPDGATVFVTGFSRGVTSGLDYATVAYNAASGARRWVSRYDAVNRFDIARAVAVSPGGRSVFVTGFSRGVTSGLDYATVAYSAATGARRWVSRYNGPGNGADLAGSVAAGPGGRTVFVTGTSDGVTSREDYATIAYSAATGARRWVSRYNGPGNAADITGLMAVSQGGGAVFVTGTSGGVTSGDDYATVAYDAATGARLWASRYNGPANGRDSAFAAAAGPDGDAVFVTGISFGGVSTDTDYATIAYRG
jgi:hypothetical protein